MQQCFKRYFDDTRKEANMACGGKKKKKKQLTPPLWWNLKMNFKQ